MLDQIVCDIIKLQKYRDCENRVCVRNYFHAWRLSQFRSRFPVVNLVAVNVSVFLPLVQLHLLCLKLLLSPISDLVYKCLFLWCRLTIFVCCRGLITSPLEVSLNLNVLEFYQYAYTVDVMSQCVRATVCII